MPTGGNVRIALSVSQSVSVESPVWWFLIAVSCPSSPALLSFESVWDIGSTWVSQLVRQSSNPCRHTFSLHWRLSLQPFWSRSTQPGHCHHHCSIAAESFFIFFSVSVTFFSFNSFPSFSLSYYSVLNTHTQLPFFPSTVHTHAFAHLYKLPFFHFSCYLLHLWHLVFVSVLLHSAIHW